MSTAGAPPSPVQRIDRRTALGTLLRGTCALAAVCAGCGEAEPSPPEEDGGTRCGTVPGRPEEGWVEVPLSAHPALLEPGGFSAVRIPEALLDVVVLHTAQDCYTAVWSICTHGACSMAYVPQEALLECPCHGSRFGEDGQVLRGPATRPLAVFRAARVGSSLWIHRPL
ncbi:ubiquinol-cytochrome c reductase iron-sulfur subunit [Stigmatella aurantiaca]|uniref:Iron-sulfur cluster-binding protein, Rieske family n=1 Tax=Stigmatella aurantiaca (strain DW4/3-1) TaxID=378806 RepID=Q08Y17_STIAD|nr:Rieske (2Fe-2S) protein [Stigmatella aurantiaca]ADO69974.1 Iron-sulfur cluster-binding protein, Rieske family [Stigmatella aurantiaca DW4/3-1]EAU65363.1 putative iron-sulphur protein [Stigmatella aurantiaca DW4/3-1]